MEDCTVFFCNRSIKDFREIVKNTDIEEVLMPESIQPKLTLTPGIHTVCSLQVKNDDTISPTKNDDTISPMKNDDTIKPTSTIKLSENNVKTFKQSNSDDFRIFTFDEILSRNENFVKKFILKRNTVNHNEILSLKRFHKKASPINRFTYKILNKLNIYSNKFPQQYINFGGREILLGGNMGGDKKLIVLKTVGEVPKTKKKLVIEEKMNVKFPPRTFYKRKLLPTDFHLKSGPLSKKAKLNEDILDSSLGKIELVKFPSVGLEVFPTIGAPLDKNVRCHLKRIRDSSGLIDASWAKFASSTLKSKASKGENLQTFVIPYENNQSRILMRRDINMNSRYNMKQTDLDKNVCRSSIADLDLTLDFLDNYTSNDNVVNCCKSVLSDLINTVCIGEFQNHILQIEEETECETNNDVLTNCKIDKKVKGTKRLTNELKKLNVTIIDIDLNGKESENCNKDHCKAGCVCCSLNMKYSLNEHCGLPECMFECKCKINDKSISNLSDPDQAVNLSRSVVLNLQNQMNRNLSKEEKKFQCTFIRTPDQTILLSDKRRDTKPPKRFECYGLLTNTTNNLRELKVLVPKLPHEFVNMVPWCMVHNLYKCFCKGLFLDGKRSNFSEHLTYEEAHEIIENTEDFKIISSSSVNESCRNVTSPIIDNLEDSPDRDIEEDSSCARTMYNSALLEKVRLKAVGYKKQFNECNREIEKTETSTASQKNIEKVFPEECMENIGKTLKSATNSQTGEIKSSMVTLMQNKPELFKKVCDRIKPFKLNELYSLSLRYIISNFMLKKIYIWLTIRPPYLQYITLEDNITCKRSCVNIKNASASLIDIHPPYVKDIVKIQMHNDIRVILYGRSFAWQITATATASVTKENDLKKSEKTVVNNNSGTRKKLNTVSKANLSTKNRVLKVNQVIKRKISKQITKRNINQNEESENNVNPDCEESESDKKPEIEKVSDASENRLENSQMKISDNSKTNKSSSTAETSMNNEILETLSESKKKQFLDYLHNNSLFKKLSSTKVWFMIFPGRDFTRLNVPHKNYHVTIQNIYLGIEEARQRNKFIRVSTQTSDEVESFGLYIPPYHGKKMCIFLGPFEYAESLNLSLSGFFSDGVRSMGDWLSLKHYYINKILNVLSSSKEELVYVFASRICAMNLDQMITNKMMGMNVNFYEVLNKLVGCCLQNNTVLPLVTISPEYCFRDAFLKSLLNIFKNGKNRENPLKEICKILNVMNKKSNDSTENPSNSKYDTKDDDIIIVPNEIEILEISDSE